MVTYRPLIPSWVEQALCSTVCLMPYQHAVCTLEQSSFYSPVSHRSSIFPLYINVLSKQTKRNFNVHIRGFYTNFTIKWDIFIPSSLFGNQIHWRYLFSIKCLSSLVASTLFSKIVLGGACEAQQTFFCLYPSCDLVLCCVLSTFLLGTAEQTLNKSNNVFPVITRSQY